MIHFKEDTLDCLKDKFYQLVLSNKRIVGLFLYVSHFDTEDHHPTFFGNLFMFIDTRIDDWLEERWTQWQDLNDIRMPIDKVAWHIQADIIQELKSYIPDHPVTEIYT
jgi:truncated hemoglobin YjbI